MYDFSAFDDGKKGKKITDTLPATKAKDDYDFSAFDKSVKKKDGGVPVITPSANASVDASLGSPSNVPSTSGLAEHPHEKNLVDIFNQMKSSPADDNTPEQEQNPLDHFDRNDLVKSALEPYKKNYDDKSVTLRGQNNEFIHSGESTFQQTGLYKPGVKYSVEKHAPLVSGTNANAERLTRAYTNAMDDEHEALNNYSAVRQIVSNKLFPDGLEAKKYVDQRRKDGKLSADNETDQIALTKAQNYQKEKNRIDKYGNLVNAAIDYARENDSNFDKKVRTLENADPAFQNRLKDPNQVDQAYRNLLGGVVVGKKVAEYLQNPDIRAIATRDELMEHSAEFHQLSDHLLEKYPDFGINVVANEVSRERQKRGLNSNIANFNTAAFDRNTDAIANELYAADPVKKNIYDTFVKSHKKKYIDVPGFFNRFYEGAESNFEGVKNTLDIPYTSASDNIDKEMRGEINAVSADEKGWAKGVSEMGRMSGLVASMAIGNKGLGALGLPASVAEKANVGLSFWGNEIKNADNRFPDNRSKAILSGTANTIAYGLLSDIFPASQVNKAFGNVKKELSSAISDLSDEQISSSVKQQLSSAFQKGIGLVGDIAKQHGKGVAEMAALSEFNRHLDKMLGMDDQTFKQYHPNDETLDVVKSMAIGNLLPSVGAGYGKFTQRIAARDAIWEGATNPLRFNRVVSDASLPDNVKNDILGKISFAAKTKESLDEQGVPESEQKNFLLRAVNNKVLMDRADKAQEPSVRKRIMSQVDRNAEINDAVISGIPEEKAIASQAKDTVQEFYDHDLIPKGDRKLLETNQGDQEKPKLEYDEEKSLDYLKYIAQHAHGFDENGKDTSGGGPERESMAERGYPKELLDMADEAFPEYAKKREEQVHPKQASIAEVSTPEQVKSVETLPLYKYYDTMFSLPDDPEDKMHPAARKAMEDKHELLKEDPEAFFKAEMNRRDSKGEFYYDEKKRAEFQQTIDEVKNILSQPKTPEDATGIREDQGGVHEQGQIGEQGPADSGSDIQQAEEEKTVALQIEQQAGEQQVAAEVPAEMQPSNNQTTEEIPPAEPPPPGTEEAPSKASPGETVGVSHESRVERAAILGEAAPVSGGSQSVEESIARGKRLLREGADHNAVAEAFKKDGRISADDMAIVRAQHDVLAASTNYAFEHYGKDSPEETAARKAESDWYDNVVKPMENAWHRIGMHMQGEVHIDTGSFAGMRRAFNEQNGKEMTLEESKRANALVLEVKKTNEALEAKIKELTEAYDKAVAAHESVKLSIAEKAKNVAQKLRERAKIHKPGMFSAATPASLAWDGAVEVVAKTIETGGKITQAIIDGIEFIKNTDWYKGLSDADKEKAEQEFSDWHDKELSDELSPEEQKIKRLEKQLADLRKGIVPEKKEQAVDSEKVTALKAEITEEKRRLGLIKEPMSDDEKEIARLQKQLFDLEHGIKKEAAEPKESSDEAKELKSRIAELKDRQNLTDMVTRFSEKKGNKFEPQDIRDIWKYARETYIDKDVPYDTMIHNTASDLGLTPEQVYHALTQPKGTKVITDEMYKRQYDRNRAVDHATDWVKYSQTPWLLKAVRTVPRLFFGLKVLGHGTVGMVTHAGTNAFRPSAWPHYWPLFIKQFSLAYGVGATARYERAKQNFVRDPDYIFWKRAGLAIDPEGTYDDYTFFSRIGQLGKTGKLLSDFNKTGERGFFALKMFRLADAKATWRSMSDAAKADPETAKEVAKMINHGTGASKMRTPETLNTFLFAPRLEASRWHRLAIQPAKAVATYASWKSATPSQRAAAKLFARRTGELLGAYVTALIANNALLAMTDSKHRVNFWDPTQSDWLKFKIGGSTVDFTGGMISAMSFIGKIATEATENEKDLPQGKTRFELMKSTIGDYASSKLSPFASTSKDFLTQHDYKGNVMPFSHDTPKTNKDKLSWWDYIKTQQLPIPINEAINDIRQQMKEKGLTTAQADQVLSGIAIGLIVGGTGARIGQEPDKATSGGASVTIKDPVRGIKRQTTKEEYEKYSTALDKETEDALGRYLRREAVVPIDIYGDPTTESSNEIKSRKYYDDLTEEEKKTFHTKLKRSLSKKVIQSMGFDAADESGEQ